MKSPALDPARTPDASPLQVLAFLWRGRWLIGAVALAVTLAGLLFAEMRGTVWRARSVLYVERDARVGNEVSLWLESRNYANTQAKLLNSVPILQAGLDAPGVAGSALFADTDNPLAWVKRNLSVAVGEQDDLITVSLDSPHLPEACRLVNALVAAYQDFLRENKAKTASELLTWLTEKLEDYEGQLRELEKEQYEFMRRHPGVGLAKDASNIAAERYRELTAALTRAEVEMVEAEAAWRAAKSLSDSADLLRQLPFPGTALAVPRQEQLDLQRLRERRLELLAQVTPEHPDVVQLDELLARLEEGRATQDQRLAVAYVDRCEQLYEGIREKVEDLRAKVDEQEAAIRAADPAHAEYRNLLDRYNRVRDVANQLYTRVRAIHIEESLDQPKEHELNTLVYEYATPDGAFVTSSKRALVAIAAFLGLVLGVGLAWFRSLVDERLLTPEEVAATLPVLATLPRISRDRRGIVETWRRSLALGEAMRSLRTVLRYGLETEPAQVLQITSTRDRDGKSLVTAGLGIAMAQAGQRTLIVDAALHRPCQARLFGQPDELGLAQVLARRTSARGAVVGTAIDGLDLLPAGSPVPNLLELYDDRRLSALLEDLAEHYDRILIDSPTVLQDSGARTLAAVSEATLLVVRSGRTRRSDVQSALGLCASVGRPIVGAVLVGSPRPAAIGVRRAAETHGNGSLQQAGARTTAPGPVARPAGDRGEVRVLE